MLNLSKNSLNLPRLRRKYYYIFNELLNLIILTFNSIYKIMLKSVFQDAIVN